MPLYEFYCPDCHVIFNFFSRSVNTTTQPACPRCERPELTRKVSTFAISKGLAEPSAEDGMPDIDESKMEQMMTELARDAEGMNEDDPRQMARMMRKLYDATGMQMGGGIEEAIRRMEAGEDPDKIDEEMGDILEEEEPFLAAGSGKLKGLRRRLRPPSVDDTLYEM
jgi:putative FmdB family regulatory protein